MDCPLSGISNDTGGRLKPLTENVDPCLFHASSTTTPSKVTRLPPLACELKMMPDSSRVISTRVCQRAEKRAEAESPSASGTPLQQLCQCLPSNTTACSELHCHISAALEEKRSCNTRCSPVRRVTLALCRNRAAQQIQVVEIFLPRFDMRSAWASASITEVDRITFTIVGTHSEILTVGTPAERQTRAYPDCTGISQRASRNTDATHQMPSPFTCTNILKWGAEKFESSNGRGDRCCRVVMSFVRSSKFCTCVTTTGSVVSKGRWNDTRCHSSSCSRITPACQPSAASPASATFWNKWQWRRSLDYADGLISVNRPLRTKKLEISASGGGSAK